MVQRVRTIYLLLVLICVFLVTDRFTMIYIAAIFGLSLFDIFLNKKAKLSLGSFGRFYSCLIILLIITLALCFMPFYSTITNQNVIIKELLRCVLHVMLIATFSTAKISLSFYKKIWLSLLTLIVGIAVLQYIKVFDIDGILANIYGRTGQFYNSQQTTLEFFRCGSVFINPNDFAAFLAASLSIFLYMQRQEPDSILIRMLVYGMYIIAFVLSGSRSGMLVGFAMVAWHLYLTNNRKISVIIAKLICIIPIVAVVFFILFWGQGYHLSDLSALRMFQVSQGLENSFGIKLSNLINLFKQANPLNILLGFGPYDYSSSYELSMDFDIGYFVAFFGLAGVGSHCLLISSINKIGTKYSRSRKELNTCFVFIALLFGLTAGVYFNLRMFTVYLAMFLPLLYKRDGELI
jgi:hypothetical protein